MLEHPGLRIVGGRAGEAGGVAGGLQPVSAAQCAWESAAERVRADAVGDLRKGRKSQPSPGLVFWSRSGSASHGRFFSREIHSPRCVGGSMTWYVWKDSNRWSKDRC